MYVRVNRERGLKIITGLLGLMAMLGLYGCPLLDSSIADGDPGSVSGITLLVSYEVNATMRNWDGTYETVHAAMLEDNGPFTYDSATNTYASPLLTVRFNSEFSEILLVEAGWGAANAWPVETSRSDAITATSVPFAGVMSEYYFFDDYAVYRLVNPCGFISHLEYGRVQSSPEGDLFTTLVGYTCDVESYVDVAISVNEYNKRKPKP